MAKTKTKTQKQEAQVLSGRGHKKPISEGSFARSTRKVEGGLVIRKGFIEPSELSSTMIPQFTLDKIKKFIKPSSLVFVRDKQVLLVLTGKKCWYSENTNLSNYIEYFKGKNPELEYIAQNWTPADLKKRGSSVVKQVAQKGYSL